MADDKDQRILELQLELERIKAQGNLQFDAYQTVLTRRYCSAAMSELFSQRSRIGIWRKLWLALAESERALGIDNITIEALEEMRSHLYVTDSDFETARVEEKKRRHDVMAVSYFAGASSDYADMRVARPCIWYCCSSGSGYHPLRCHQLFRD
ncbi:hypothetical protein ANO14919_068410 [Xylariales sp. No.14919]|nr:hypothetical protein ANO14919_068410 [Xylariales sp. No.14919]